MIWKWQSEFDLSSVTRIMFSVATSNPIIIHWRFARDHMRSLFLQSWVDKGGLLDILRVVHIMAMPWSDSEMGFQTSNCLFWGFYLWILSGKSKLAWRCTVRRGNVFVWFCSFVNLQCNYRNMNISPPISKILHYWFGKSHFCVQCVFSWKDLEHGNVTSVPSALFITLKIMISASIPTWVHICYGDQAYMLIISSSTFTLFRKPSLWITTQAIAWFS